jgi:parallel beta-helix repeat protein
MKTVLFRARLAARLLLLLGLAAALAAPAARAETITVGPGAAIRTPAAVPWASLRPGDVVVVQPGVYRDGVIIGSHGSAEQPITLRGAPGVVIENSVLLEGASHVVIDGIALRKSHELPGFILRHGASFDTIENSSVEDSGLGIWIGDGAGGGHRLLNNTLHDNRTHGIAIDVVNAPEGQETLIGANRVYRNAMHGMEINGNRYVIQDNVVWQNGIGLSGTSGIHLFAKDQSQGTGRFNIIRYNIVSGQQETDGQDGNGIQLDQWCDNNQVYFNAVFANDGAGIVLFDASHNLIANNTLFDNMRDTGHRHAYRADLVIATDYTKNTDHALDNVLRNNLVYTFRPDVLNIYVDRFAARGTKEISNNLFFRADPDTDMYFWAGSKGRTIAAWNALKPGAPDLSYDPQLSDLALPRNDLAGAKGLIPRPGSPVAGAGSALPVGVAHDLANLPFQRVPIGAYAPAN